MAVSLEPAPMGLRPGFCGDLHGIVERDHGGCGGIVRNKDGGEILITGTGPLEWTFYCVAAADGFDAEACYVVGEKDVAAAFGGGVVVVVDAGGGVGSGCDLVAESGGPCGWGEDFSAFVEDGGFDVQDVGVVETESLADDEILIGVFEGDRGWGREIAFIRSYVERGAEAVAQSFVVGPERERVTEFLSGSGVDEIERAVLGVVVELFQDPGFYLGSAVGEGDFVEIVLDYGFGFGGGLLCDRVRWKACRCRGWGGGRRCGRRLCLDGVIFRLGGRRGHVFLQYRLRENEDYERNENDDEEAALGAWFLLRILIVGQSF